jgi:membrane associated rhomboid family serine protease
MSEDHLPRFSSVRDAATRPVLADAGLVLAARGIPCHEVDIDGRWHLLVPAADAAQARAELEAFGRENPAAAPAPLPPVGRGTWWGIAGYLGVIWQQPLLHAAGVYGGGSRNAGRMAAGLVRDGEWWRTITALTLHADLAHIVVNSGFAVLFGLLLGRHLGGGVGWLLVLVAAAAANGINAWLQPASFSAIGASTATFAALGIVAAFTFRRLPLGSPPSDSPPPGSLRRRAGPLFAALCLLVLTGLGDGSTDVAGHVLGLCCGLVAGAAAARVRVLPSVPDGMQRAAGLGALALVALAWWMA